MTIGATISPRSASMPRREGGNMVLGCAIIAALLAIVGSYGAGFGWWHFTFGLLAVAAALPIALVVAIVCLVQLVRKRVSLIGKGGISLLIAMGLIGALGYWVRAGMIAPPIHDVTTNVANPPAFQKLALRADNLAGVDTIANWEKLHRTSYADIQPIILNVPADRAMALVRKAVSNRGWALALVTADRIEATDIVSPFRFKDDVVIVVNALPNGGSEIQMRSVSRVGVSDLGMNASRLRALGKDIRAATGEKP